MATDGHYNQWSGDPKDVSFYCQHCGSQVPAYFKHHHASEVPALKARVAVLEEQRSKTNCLLDEIFDPFR